MSWEDCNVILNSNNGIFYTGDIVTGSVSIQFKSESKIKELTFKVKGTSKASWTTSLPTIPHFKIYAEKCDVFRISLHIFKDINGKVTKPGIVNIPFHFSLPNNLPSSFSDSIGCTYYRIVIKNQRAYKLKQKKVVPLMIFSTLNLNLMNCNSFTLPLVYEVSRTFGKDKEFILRIKTYKGVGSNQENVPFEAYIRNENKAIITKIVVNLVQKLEYTVSSGYHKASKKLHKLEFKEVKNSLCDTYQFYVNIPMVPPSSILNSSTLINISYVYMIKVCFQFHTCLWMEIPVVIGTTPVIFKPIK